MARPSLDTLAVAASHADRIVARAAIFPLLCAAALAAQVPARFSLGDLREQVRQVQGAPQVIERLHSQGVEHWRYENATVTFDPQSGRVVAWHDPSRTLRLGLRAEHHTRDSLVSLGTDLGDVARLLGTPWAITRDRDGQALYLAYGRSLVRVHAASLRVTGWTRRDANLRLAANEDSLAQLAFTRVPTPGSPARRWAPAEPPPPLAPSTLVVQRVLVHDASGDGQLAPREFADLTVRLRNRGPAHTAVTPLRLIPGTGLVPVAGTPDTLWLPALAPGDSADLVISAYTLKESPGTELVLLAPSPGGLQRLVARIPTAPAPSTAAAAGPRDIDDAPVAPVRNPDALAVIVGIEDYRRLPAARFAERDAALMRRYAGRTLGILDDPTHLAFRTGSDATGSEVRRLLGERGWLARRVTANTDVLVYFAGHGIVGGDGRTPILLPADGDAAYPDATGLDLHALFDHLARLPARSITVVVDACFSGLARSGRPLLPGTRAAAVSIEHPALVRRNMSVFLAARGTQVAGDLPDQQHGTFSYYLARGLQGAADTNGDQAITVSELGAFTEQAVQRAAAATDREQQPLAIARDSTRVLARLPSPR